MTCHQKSLLLNMQPQLSTQQASTSTSTSSPSTGTCTHKYQYLACKYKYLYQYPKIVLKYRSSQYPVNARSIINRVRTILVLGYWVLGNIHRYWIVLLLGDIFCCSDTQYNTNQTAVSTIHMPVND